MFKRLIICLFLFGAPGHLAAQTFQESITSQLEAQGFSRMTASRTWLGRVRLVAYRDDLRREIVFNPQTGEILRDYWRTIDDEDEKRLPRLINPGSGDNDNGDRDDDDDDENDDEDDDDDRDDDDDDDADDDDRDDDDDDGDDDD